MYAYSEDLMYKMDLNKLIAPYSEAYFYFNDNGDVCFLTDTLKLAAKSKYRL